MANPDEKVTPLDNLGSVQRKTNRFGSEQSDAWLTQNTDFSEIGSVKKKEGYAKRGDTLTSTTSTSSSTSTTTTSTSTSTSTSTTTSTSTS